MKEKFKRYISKGKDDRGFKSHFVKPKFSLKSGETDIHKNGPAKRAGPNN
jgi:hypothetical protein